MIKEKTAVFIGHKDCYGLSCDLVKAEIERLIEKGIDTFLNGGMGGFDNLCRNCVNDLKNKYPHISHFLIIPYLDFKRCNFKDFDSVIYPELEKYHYKTAIPQRNKWMVDNSAYALCYVNHCFGGAGKTYERAIKKGLMIINMGVY